MDEMPTKHQDDVIADEVLRTRVRQMGGVSEQKPQRAFSRLSTNPLISLVIGFVLTGLVGTSLTYYFTERQKQNDALRQSQQKELDDERSKEARNLEFLRQKNIIEIENKQHQNAQALEDQRAKETRDTDAFRAARQKDIDYARSQINVVEDRKIEQAKLLDIFVKYISSEDPLQRTFGYEMFVSFGQGDLAARMTSQKGDLAGRTILIGIQSSASQSESTRQLATRGLAALSDIQLKRILAVISVFETGRADGRVSTRTLKYGDLLPFQLKALQIYMSHPNATYKEELRRFMPRIEQNDSSLRTDAAFDTLIDHLDADSILSEIFKIQFKDTYLSPSLELVDQLGVTTLLGLAAIFDTEVLHGPAATKRFLDQTSTRMHGYPKTGVDEKEWIKSFIDVRHSWLARQRPPLNRFASRPEFFLAQAEKNNWDLLPPFQVNSVVVE